MGEYCTSTASVLLHIRGGGKAKPFAYAPPSTREVEIIV